MFALGQKKQTCAAHKPMSALCQKRTLRFCPFLLRAAEPFSRGIFDMAALSRPR